MDDKRRTKDDMKADKILDELINLAKSMDYDVRRESGTFKGGACVVHDRRLILINRSMPLEAASVILARALAKIGVTDDSFLKPAVRDLLDREQAWVHTHPEVTFTL
jgi:hypothetical protein